MFKYDCRLIVSVVCLVLLFYPWPNLTALPSSNATNLSLTADPSAVTIKVGDSARVNLTVTSTGVSGSQLCFAEEGFPSSGFNLTFLPECISIQQSTTKTALIVEATPAAAPQNFTAAILATSGNETASTPLTITVIPAISPWIPWLGILLFFAVIGLALFLGSRRSKNSKTKTTNP